MLRAKREAGEDVNRADRGLSPYGSRKPKLEPHVRELVGKYGSANIAKGWDVDANAVEAYRKLAKVELQVTGDDDLPVSGRWKAEWISLFPQHTNAQIARATGIPIDAVRQKRKSLRIAGPAGRTYWKLVSADELNAMTDAELASQYGGLLLTTPPSAFLWPSRTANSANDCFVSAGYRMSWRITSARCQPEGWQG